MNDATLCQPDHMEIGSTRFDCRCGYSFLDRVFVDLPHRSDSWLACCGCGWDSRPDWYEPGAFYQHRYYK